MIEALAASRVRASTGRGVAAALSPRNHKVGKTKSDSVW